jgi:hypothetical protein
MAVANKGTDVAGGVAEPYPSTYIPNMRRKQGRPDCAFNLLL